MIPPKLFPPLATVLDQVLAHIDLILGQPPLLEAKHFLVLMDGVLLGGEQLLRALQDAVRAQGWICTDILPADVLWNDDEYWGWKACFLPFAPPSLELPQEQADCHDRFYEYLDALDPKLPFFVFIEHLEKFAIQSDGVQDQARKTFLTPLMRDFYAFPIFVIAQARHFSDQPVDYLKGFPLAPATQKIPLSMWTAAEILGSHPKVAGLDEPLRSEVLRLAGGSPGTAARLTDRLRAGDNLRVACGAVLTDLMQGYDNVTGQWPYYQRELSAIVAEQNNQIDILDLPSGGVLAPDSLRRLLRLGVIEPNGTNYRVAGPFEQLLRGAQ